MRVVIFILVLIAALVMAAGCTQTPATVEQETQTALNNVSVALSAPTTSAIPEPTFAPLATSAGYIAPPTQTPRAIVSAQDPIIGNWIMSPGSPYSCNANVLEDGTGAISCEYVYDRSITWQNVGWDQNRTWMMDYNITDLSSGTVYPAEYSTTSGDLYSSILPGGAYFERGG